MPDSGESVRSTYLMTDASSSDESLLLHNLKNDEENIKVSFKSLFRYSNVSEKLMIFIGILGAIAQGLSLPIVIHIMGNLINILISLVSSVAIRNSTGIHNNDALIKEYLNVLSDKSQIGYNTFFEQHPELERAKLLNITSSTNNNNISTTFITGNEFWNEFHRCMLYFCIVTLVSFLGSFLMDSLLNISAMRQVTRIRSLTFQSIIKQDISWHETKSPGELASRIISDSILIEDGMGDNIGVVIQNLVTFFGCFGLAFKSGWKLSLYMSTIFPLILVFGVTIAIILKISTKKNQDAFAELGGIAYEAFTQIRTIASFGTEQKEIDRYVEKLKATKKYGTIMGTSLGMTLGLVFGVLYASFAIAFIFGTRFIHDGEMIYGEVLSVFIGIMLGSTSISNMALSLGSFSQATGAAELIFKIIEREPTIKMEEGISPEKPLKGTIEFQDVHFNYPSRPDVEVLKGISFKCLPGQTVALVGASGSGKSTTVQLLERFYNKRSGRILIDGRDIEDYNVKWLRSQIGLVSQEPTLFDVSIAKNIAINSPKATKEKIIETAKLANAHKFILNLSHGYETNAGERGLQLSGGQKQRICIARALINNPKILLLDEATSALDNQSEKVVQSALELASSGRTTLVIAHRLSTIKNADLIIVMDKGAIIESGTHEELMKLQKNYFKLVKNQEINIEENKEDNDDTAYEDKDEDSAMKNSDTEIYKDNTVNKRFSKTHHRQSTMLSHITSTFNSLSRRRTSGAFSELIDEDEMTYNNENDHHNKSNKAYDLKNMPWGKYFHYCKPYWYLNILGFIGSFFDGSVQPAFSFIFSSALTVFTKQGDELIDGGLYWGLMFIILGLCNFIAYNFKFGGFFVAGDHICYDLRREMYASLIHQEVGFFDTTDIGDVSNKPEGKSNKPKDKDDNGGGGGSAKSGSLISQLATEVTNIRKLNSTIGSIFQIGVTVICGFSIAFYYSWKLSLILLIVVPFIGIGSFISAKSTKKRNVQKRDLYESSTEISCEAISNIKAVYALNLTDYFSKYYDSKLNESSLYNKRKIFVNAIGTGFSNAVTFAAFIMGFWVGTIFLENGELEFNSMFKVVMAIILTAMAVGQNNAPLSEASKSMDSFMRVNEIIEREPKIDSRNTMGIKKSISNFKGNLEISNIRFRYPSRPQIVVLRMGNTKISIPSGKMCAFVGASGSGKSTIIGLLPRWYDAIHGSIQVDNIENKEYNIKWLREEIGIVSQEPCLFNISIKENIKYGKLEATDKEVYEAAKKANIHDFIMSLPEKYDTLVGGVGTAQMSGGQKQRIAIARAIIRNPKILLLDEATSALDAESELVVQKALEDAAEGRTTITIAHRLSTIKNADIICVFKEGKVIEIGKHDDLMEAKGEYYNMVLAGDRLVSK